jgi:8-oxo-dGTP pyrophosphatase MutT (NUDIX family)
MDKRSQIVEALRRSGHEDLAVAMEETAIPLVASYAKNGDSILYDNEWLQLRETPDGYVYSHEAKSDGQGVAVLAYRKRDGGAEVVGRYERCPCHQDGFALTSLTGLMDRDDEDAVGTAVRELQEEAGIEVAIGEMQPLGSVRPSKQADTFLHLFGVDVGDRDVGDAIGDGSSGEQDAYCAWVTPVDACLSKSPVLATMVVRALMIGQDW